MPWGLAEGRALGALRISFNPSTCFSGISERWQSLAWKVATHASQAYFSPLINIWPKAETRWDDDGKLGDFIREGALLAASCSCSYVGET